MRKSFSRSSGRIRFVALLSLAACGLIPLWLWADAPAWWAERGVLNLTATPDDYAVVNQGQVKHFAKQAYEEIKAKAPGGAGATLDSIWGTPAAGTDDYAAVNLGQLKNVAEPFYARLQELNYTGQPLVSGQTRPWSGTADDYALANAGQVKNLFSFDPGILAQAGYILIDGGDGQIAAAGQVLPVPLKVLVIDEQGLPLASRTVTFSVSSGSGVLSSTLGGAGASSVTVTTGVLGSAWVYLTPDGPAGARNEVVAAITGDSATFHAWVAEEVASSEGGATVPPYPIADTPNPGGNPVGMPINDPMGGGNSWQPEEPPSALKIKLTYPHADEPRLEWTSVYTRNLVQRRTDGGNWVSLGIVEGQSYPDSGLLTGHLYEYRVAGVVDEAAEDYTSFSEIRAYDVPLARSVDEFPVIADYGASDPEVSFWFETGFYTYTVNNYGLREGEPGYPWRTEEWFWYDVNASKSHIWSFDVFAYYGDFFSSGFEYNVDIYAGARPKSWLELTSLDWGREKRVVRYSDAKTLYPLGGGSFAVNVIDDSPYYIKYRGQYISAYSIPSAGLYAKAGEQVAIIPHFVGGQPQAGEGGDDGLIDINYLPSVVTWTGTGVSAMQQDGTAVGSGAEVDFLNVKFNKNALPGDESVFTMHLPEGAVVVPVPSLTFRYEEASGGDGGYDIPSTESSGPKYRKIALNGAPLSDEKPQSESESDQQSEETYIDALTLGLRHDTTDTYQAVPASDLFLGVRRSATSDIWNPKNGMRIGERPDRPFGAGWTTNLAANIHFTNLLGQADPNGSKPDTATVTDENGTEYTFALLYGSDASYTESNGYTAFSVTYVPLPSSNHDQGAYLCSLMRNVDGTFTFSRKYGSKLTYAMTNLSMRIASDRTDADCGSGARHTYARLTSVADRYQNHLRYEYSSGNTLVPSVISVRHSDGTTGASLSIRQDDNGHITDVWDAAGKRVQYSYDYDSVLDKVGENSADPDSYVSSDWCELAKVTLQDGGETNYAYQMASEVDQNPDNDANVKFYHHLDLKGITDALNRSYGFEYVADTSKYDYSATHGYHLKYGIPYQVSKTTLPNDSHAWFGNDSSGLKISTATNQLLNGWVRKTHVVDALGNQRDYDFTDANVETLPSFETVYKHEVKFDNPRMVYYKTMTITPYAGNGTSKVALGGTETFNFSPETGMSVVSATDFSGNTTSYTYGDPFDNATYTTAGGDSAIYSYYSDPTKQTNAFGQYPGAAGHTKTFTYGTNRIMKSSTDENDTVTAWTVDTTGRRMDETVTDKNGNVLSKTLFYYKDTAGAYLDGSINYAGVSLNFLTKKVVQKDASSTTDPAWVADLVTVYVPTSDSRVSKEIMDPDGLALTTTYTYDANGNKLTSKDPRGNVTTFSYDKRNRLTHVTYVDHHQKRFYYDARGNKTEEIDENGVATFWQYDALNRVKAQIRDMDGSLKAQAETDGTHAITTDAGTLRQAGVHLVTSYTYNALNAKLTETGPKLTERTPGVWTPTVTKYEYDALQRLVKKIEDYSDPTTGHFNYVTQYFYDPAKNCGGSVFNSTGFKPTKVIDPRGYVTEVTYDKLYRPVTEKVQYAKTPEAPANAYATTTKDYDDVGNLLQVTAPAATGQTTGTITKTIYDGLRRPTSITEGHGTTISKQTTTDYTSTGLAWRSIEQVARDTQGVTTTRETLTEYDSVARAIKTTGPPVADALANGATARPVTRTEYDAAGNVDATIDPLQRRTDYHYDNRNRRYKVEQPEVLDALTGQPARPTTITAYDGVGNVIAVQDPRGFVTTTDYDNANRPEYVYAPAVVKPDGTVATPVTHTTYDTAGHPLTVTDANGHVTTNTYDALGRLHTTTDAEQITVTNAYDAAGNRTDVWDGKDQHTAFAYDGLNRNTTVTDPADHAVTYEYDAVNKTARVDSLNRRTEYRYDDRHRLTGVIYVESGDTTPYTPDRSYTYDLLGELLTVTESAQNGLAGVAYSYDLLGRQLTETSGGQQHTYDYDLNGNRIHVTYGGTGTLLTSTYDELNRLDTLTENGRVTTYGYDLAGNRVLKQLPNEEIVSTQFDPLGRAVQITTYKANGSLLLEQRQAHDLVGNLVRLQENYFASTLPDRTVTNTYDDINRLHTETVAEGTAKTTATVYGYDDANNRTSRSVSVTENGATTTKVASYDYTNQLNQLEGYTEGELTVAYAYDDNGNRHSRTIGGQTDTYAYDYENRLTGLTKTTVAGDSDPGTGTYAYVYDYRTRRVQRTENGEVTKLVFSGGVSVQEYAVDTATTLAAEYIRGSDWGGGVGGLLYSLRDGAPSYKHYNSRGDVISATNATGAVTWQASYEAFGTRTEEIGSTQDRQKANTKEEDPTGLLNEGFRYRDLETGTFITRDPLGFVDGPNMYAYVVQNPWSKFDPLGLYWGEKYVKKAVSIPVNLTVNTGRHVFESARQVVELKPITATRVLVGVPASILSGDIFDKANSVNPQATGASVNGIWNNSAAAEQIGKDAQAATGQVTQPVQNGTHLGIPLVRQKLGDVFQCLSESLGAINTPSLNYADTMRTIDRNHPTGTLEATAHSQGGSVLMGGAALLDDSINKRTSVQTFGAQLAAPKGMFKDVYNERSSGGLIGDPVPFIDPRNLRNTLTGNVTGYDQSTGHGWSSNYGKDGVSRAEKQNP